jgi:hypothetical protein
MAHTYRKDDRAGRTIRDGQDNRHSYRKENGFARKLTNRKLRHDTRLALTAGEMDNLPQYHGTSGWITN